MTNKRIRKKVVDKKFGNSNYISNERNTGDVISFSLTQTETQLYYDWLASLRKVNGEDNDDPFGAYDVVFNFAPFVLGTRITAVSGSQRIVLRSGIENDEVKKKRGQDKLKNAVESVIKK